MRCNNCGAESPEDGRFCPQCGVQLVKAGAAPPPLPTAPPPGPPPLPPAGATAVQPAGVGARCVEGFIDLVIMFVIGYVLAMLTGQTTRDGYHLHGLPALLWWLAGFAYFAWFEGKAGATIGKMVVGLRVVKTDGADCDMRAAVIRTIVRPIDYFFMLGVVVMAFSKRNQRVGDMLADTVVVKAKARK